MPDRPLFVSGTPAAGEPPSTWTGAFAALPAETPPADGWARMAARLPAARATVEPVATAASAAPRAAARRRRWALAAMLAAALPLGLWLSLRAPRPDPPTAQTAAAPARAAQREPAPPNSIASSANPGRTAAGFSDPATIAGREEPRTALATSPGSDQERRTAELVKPATPASGPSRRRAPRHPAATAAAVASATPAAVATAATDANAPTQAAANSDDARLIAQLRALQAESSQLEALVAAARDERVASAAAALMGAGLDQRLRLIDTALGDAALAPTTRVALWRERVESLRSLAGVESTQRWYAARGERYDSALVRVD